MDVSLSAQLALAALVFSLAAFFFSLVAAFPGLKVLLAAIRDAVLWLALLLVLGGVGYVLWQERKLPPAAAASAAHERDLAAQRTPDAWPVLRDPAPTLPAPGLELPRPAGPSIRRADAPAMP